MDIILTTTSSGDCQYSQVGYMVDEKFCKETRREATGQFYCSGK